MNKKTINLNGEIYISMDTLISIMTEICVDGTSVDDLYICESERDNLSACQDICNLLEKEIPGFKRSFKGRYSFERFHNRTTGV